MIRWNYVIAAGLLLSCRLSTAAVPETKTVSPLWQEYEAEKKAGKSTSLPDFSYAGYHRGEKGISYSGKTFNVKDFGAIPDDLLDDAAGIAAAIKAAEQNGGGIVYLPRGRYLVNTTLEKRTTIAIHSSNIVIKGDGATAAGTIIHSIQPYGGNFDPHNPQRLHLGDIVFLISSPTEEKKLGERTSLCKVTADAARETFSLTVDRPEKLNAGNLVYLYACNQDILRDMIQPYQVDPKWTTITRNIAPTIEIHEIKAVEGHRVTFREPIRYEIKAAQGWDLREFSPLREVGIEDICFMGNAYHRYYHHRSDYDDSGWSFIKMKGVTNSWVRRCAFINCSQTISVNLASSVSLLELIIAGNKGHHIPRAVYFDYGLLGGLIEDRAGYDHGPSLSWGTVATVFWRCSSAGAIDSHAGRPYANLFDNISGGVISSSGGLRDYPQHLRYLVIWNYENQADREVQYDFWLKGSNNKFVKPIIAGFHGTPAKFNLNNVGIMESQGRRVSPDSLYEAQLQLRLGRLPDWLNEVQKDFAVMTRKELPAYFDRNRPESPFFFYVERFDVAALLKFVTTLSLQMNNSQQFTFTLDALGMTITADQGLVRNALYSLMITMYKYNKENNRIIAGKTTQDNREYARFLLQPGKDKLAAEELKRNPDFQDALLYAAKVGGQVKVTSISGRVELELIIPVTPTASQASSK